MTSFVGREREVAEIKRLMATSRLLTLTGTGGSGKTRLAFQVVTDLQEELEQRVCWVELAALTDPALMPQAVASALDVGEQAGRSLVDTLADALRPRELLLVLDNCEHIVAACAYLAEVLLRACPKLQMLATSREALRITGETTWQVPSLCLPDPHHLPPLDELIQSNAVQLFVERAATVLPSFTLTQEHAMAVVQICQRLDGIPLAIELAAARVNVLSVKQIAARLDDCCRLLTVGSRTALSRQQTLRATIDWSYDLLSEQERTVFRRLSVFPGSWSLEAAEAICAGEDSAKNDILDMLSHLVAKSLVIVEERNGVARYRFLEMMRQYSYDKLQLWEEAENTHKRHQDWYLCMAQRAEPELGGAQQAAWFDSLEMEHDNLRAVLCWTLTRGEAETAAHLGGALWRFWLLRGYLSEGRRWLEEALAGVAGHTAVRAKALNAAGLLARHQNDYAQARVLLEESLDLWRSLENSDGIAYALYNLGTLMYDQGNYEQAITSYQEGLALLQTLEDTRGIALILSSLGLTVLYQGDYERATRLCEESLALLRKLGDTRSIAGVLINLALTALKQGHAVQARVLCEESLVLRQQLGDKGGIAHTLTVLGEAALVQISHQEAITFYQESLVLRQEMGDKEGVAVSLEGLAEVVGSLGQPERAVQLSEAAQVLRDTIGTPQPLPDLAHYACTIVAAPAQCDEITTTCVQPTKEHALLLEQSISEALAELTKLREKSVALPIEETAPTKVKPELRLYTLGPVRVYRDKHALDSSDWRYAKAKELLFYLLCHRSRTKEQIGLALWPDVSSAQLRDTFHATLYNLRQALGRPEWIIFKGNRYAFNRELSYWFDAETFESYVTQGCKLQVQAPTQAIQYLEKAAKLYQGDFLEDMLDGEWYLLQQRAWRKMYLDALLTLGQLLFAEAQYGQAADIYRQLIARDNYLEVAHRELMRCYAQQGERGQALRHYQTLVALMRDEFGSSPASETTVLFERLSRGEES